MWFIMILLVLAAIVAVGAYFCFRRTFYQKSPHIEDESEIYPLEQYQKYAAEILALRRTFAAIACEDVFLQSRDGLRLRGRFYDRGSDAVDIFFHGYRGGAVRDCSGGAMLALERGHSVLVVDERCHGMSEGNVITFGVRERLDCLDWIAYITGRCGENVKIGLSGISMGAATVLMAAGLELPEQVKCIVADCGYTSPRAIIRKVIGEMGLPVPLLYPLVRLGAWLYGGFRLESADALSAMEKAKVPILFIHGQEDAFVPIEMSRENFAACRSEKKMLTFPGAVHGMSYMLDVPRYTEEVRRWEQRWMGE